MLIYSFTTSADGYIADREGGIDWSEPDDEKFRIHLEHVAELGGFLLGRRLYETMAVWESDASLREAPLGAAFADVWNALPKVVFSRTLTAVANNARLARGTVADEVATLKAATGGHVGIGGAELAAQAITLGLVDEFRIFRAPVLLGGGTPFFPPVARAVPLDLRETRELGAGVVYERYQLTRSP